MSKQDDEGIEPSSSVLTRQKGGGTGSAGQSGDTQGLSDVAEAGGESVEELLEEGPVSYTHLDVYKRQHRAVCGGDPQAGW